MAVTHDLLAQTECRSIGRSVKLLLACSSRVVPGFSLLEIHDQHLYSLLDMRVCRNEDSFLAEGESVFICSRSQSQSQGYFTTGGLPLISSSCRQDPLRPTTRMFFKLNPCSHSPYVTSSLTRRWVCLLWRGFAFVKCTYRTYSVLLKFLPLALYTSPLSVRLCKEDQSQSQSYFTTGCLPPFSSSWWRAPWDSRPAVFFSTEHLHS
jgi:hypothetical protein